MGKVSTHIQRLLRSVLLPILLVYSAKPSHFVHKLPILFVYSTKPSHFVLKLSHFVPFASHFVPFLLDSTVTIRCFLDLYYSPYTYISENRYLPTVSGEQMTSERKKEKKKCEGPVSRNGA